MATKKLATYRAKRDFAKTREPSGREKVQPSSRLRFVIQKHDATRLHYDFRLELDGVFKSWAVTRGPSLDPQDKRLAVEVEDHPLDYGDFEGTIPKGQYGGGTVMIWDRGYWIPEGGPSPQEALAKGDLKFSLEGRKLHGSWVLVRMKGDRFGGKRTNWLLIKHKDEAVRPGEGEAILAEDRSAASGRSLDQIAAGKGRSPKPFMLGGKTGRADAVWHSNRAETPSSRNRTNLLVQPGLRKVGSRIKGPIPDFVAPQLCRVVERPPTGGDWIHEIKLDGYRLQLRAEGGAVTLKTRSGLDWTRKLLAIAEAADHLPNALIDGEVVAPDKNGVPHFDALQAALAEGKTDGLIYFAFDLLFEGGEDLRALPLTSRKERLQSLLDAADGRRIRYLEHIEADGDQVMESARRLSLEGIVSKRRDDPYRSGRHDSWAKSKLRGGQEVIVGGWAGEEGNLRALLVGVHRGGDLAYAGRVGTGFNPANSRGLLARLKSLAAAKSPFTAGPQPPRRDGPLHWVRPELVADIELAGWTEAGIVRQGAFKALREDKPAEEVDMEKPSDATPKGRTKSAKAARPAAAEPRTPIAGSSKPSVLGVAISHPDKAMWPDGGDGVPVTKLDLARYYEAMGAWIMPHIQGRPCSIVRCPDGIGGQRFFQRHEMAGMSGLLNSVKVAGEPKPYLQIDRIEGLAALAQIGALELHPWNCAPGKPEVPGRLVFDIDPAPDVPFAAVIDAARELRDRLEKVGLVGFCKTTGGKGLHVSVPLAAGRKDTPDWAQTKAFTRELCRQMAEDSPERYLINMSKEKREGRMFLDYLRNDRTATAVAPLSPRAREGATVSMLLTWPQVKKGLDPKSYTLRTAPRLMGRSKAWQDYEGAARPLLPAAKLLLAKAAA